MFKPRIISLIVTLGIVLFGPWMLEQARWTLDARKHLKAQIAAAPVVEQYEYERGGGVAKITGEHIYYSYKRASRDKIETWLACVDRATKAEIWYRGSNNWLNHVFIDDIVLVWWNDKSEGTTRIEKWNMATGAVINALDLAGVVRAVHVHPKDSSILFIQYDDRRLTSVHFESKNLIWETEIGESLARRDYFQMGRIREDNRLEVKQSSKGKTLVQVLDLKSGEIHYPLPEVTKETVASDTNWRMVKDVKTGLSYQLKVDWDCLILKNSGGDILFESDQQRSMEVVVIDGLLIWGTKHRTIYNVVDLSTGEDWIFSLGFDSIMSNPGMIQVTGDYLIHITSEGRLYCRSRQAGHVLWQYPLANSKNTRSSYFMIQDDLLYGVHRNRLTTFDLASIEDKMSNL